MNYSIIKRNYQKGLWGIQNVKAAVMKGVITREQYSDITGCVYPATRKEETNGTDAD